jgi:uncharacterized membrane protein YesL
MVIPAMASKEPTTTRTLDVLLIKSFSKFTIKSYFDKNLCKYLKLSLFCLFLHPLLNFIKIY